MLPDTHLRALRATARLTAFLALAACPKPEPAPPLTVAAQAPEAPEVPADLDAAACDASLDAAIEAGRKLSKHDVQCCALELEAHPIGMDWEHRNACCEALHWQAGGACTPWGPPTPPGSEGVALADAELLDLRIHARLHAPRLSAPAHLREAAIATWTGRMVNEYGSHRVFAALSAQLEAAGANPDTVVRFRAFVDEERHHGVLCGAVVEALGGEALAPLPAAPPFPAHGDVDPVEAVLRNVLSICCLSETVAVALVGAEREELPEGELRELLTRILADEVGHAHTGWRLLAALLPDDPALRRRLGEWLRVAFAHLEAHELAHLPERTWPEGGSQLGLCDGYAARALFYATVSEVIVPALDHLGLDGTGAWSGRASSTADA